MNFLDDVTYEVQYEQINRTILDGNVTTTSLIVSKVNYGDIDDDNNTCHGSYIIRFSLYPYTLQEGFNLDGQVISSCYIFCEGTYFPYKH